MKLNQFESEEARRVGDRPWRQHGTPLNKPPSNPDYPTNTHNHDEWMKTSKPMEEDSEIPEPGDAVRTRKSGMEGKVERLEGQNVYYRSTDGRLMATPMSNIIVITKLADCDDGIMEGDLLEISNALLTKYKSAASKSASSADAIGDIKTGNKRFSGIVKATNKQFANDAKARTAKSEMKEDYGHEPEGSNGWKVTDVDSISETDFEVSLIDPKGTQHGFIIKPVNFMEMSLDRFQIDSMDIRDLQTGKTKSWNSRMGLAGADLDIFNAIDEYFWLHKELQAKLKNIVGYYMDAGEHGKNPDLMHGLDKRAPTSKAVNAKDVIGAQNSIDKLKKGTNEGSMGGINRSRPAQDVSYEKVLDRNPKSAHSRVVGEQQVNELSVKTLQSYKDKAGSSDSFRTRPLRKLAKSSQAVDTVDSKIAKKNAKGLAEKLQDILDKM